VQEAALLVRALLQELGLQAWLKTTGGKGLHLFVPLRPEFDYATVKAFSEAVVVHMARTIPQRFVAKSGPRNRVGRIFIDYLRNGWVQSTAEAYSARARPGLGVSMPVRWEQLAQLTGGDHWNIASAPEYLAKLKSDPWAQYWKKPQRLGPALELLGPSLGEGEAAARPQAPTAVAQRCKPSASSPATTRTSPRRSARASFSRSSRRDTR
jgi:bifunctional non-homologous end joining protein LigD